MFFKANTILPEQTELLKWTPLQIEVKLLYNLYNSKIPIHNLCLSMGVDL